MNKGVLLILSGPSGCGKGTVCKTLFEKHKDALAFSVSCTTRAPRPGEIDGVHYHFISKGTFDSMVADEAFLEYATFVNQSYGTPLAPIVKWMDEGVCPVLEIEVQGALQVKAKRPDAVSIFLMPPSMEELARRLRGRGTESEEVVLGRLARAEEEMPFARQYDYCVINEDSEQAADEIFAILQQEMTKKGAMQDENPHE